MASKVAVFAVSIFAGCSGHPANEASRLPAIEANARSENLAGQLETENTRRAQQHAALLAASERAKGESLASRVPALTQHDPLQDTSSLVEVRVWACSALDPDRQSTMVAEMTGRQLLLLARGASVTAGQDGLKINSAASIPGVRVTETEQTGAYTVVQLDASMRIPEPLPMPRIQSESFVAPLHDIIASISQNVEDCMDRHRETHPTVTNGFVILRKMELLSGKRAPECRYQLDVYAAEP